MALLASVEEIPDESAVNEYKLLELNEFFISLDDEPVKLEIALHEHAKGLLSENKVEEAWLTLLAYNN